MGDYNGWANRSTWAAALHLNNTSEEVYIEAVKLAERYASALKAQKDFEAVHVGAYSSPRFSKKAFQDDILSLLEKTGFYSEEDVSKNAINFEELAEALNDK